ncbi:transmembrane protein, putative (macronuclear) [Tetrahymena thermophila SB210]|uniref:Transmembrane protein, putative n=1 Tax=Tetrahymena thermophila (strain SB210) TaxID=312017 RepID=W7XC30_TETTS|nr:transmembrane protein, putative [Tetrahymena thermophila SB210]EWS74018.1 transmembrane protein, putative [Tetrahymena thermophila SB210]|eukprot:XP_012653480.1 transmembrane protein, putative [Tetrahymena thermophila SB210]
MQTYQSKFTLHQKFYPESYLLSSLKSQIHLANYQITIQYNTKTLNIQKWNFLITFQSTVVKLSFYLLYALFSLHYFTSQQRKFLQIKSNKFQLRSTNLYSLHY